MPDSIAVKRALSSGCNIDGQDLTYSVYGTIEIKSNITIKNAKFIQTKRSHEIGATNIRTLYKSGGSLTLINVHVDRGRDERNGSIDESAGIFLSDLTRTVLNYVTVTGNGYGNGIWLLDSQDVLLDEVHVYDMQWSAISIPDYEQLIGIRIQRCSDVIIRDTTVKDLKGVTGNNIYSSFQSDGITLTGTNNVSIINVSVENVGEGIDFTGDEVNKFTGVVGNTNFEVAHCSVIDADSWGFKFANSAKSGIIKDSIAIRSGLGGFVFSGPSKSNLATLTSDIKVENCQAINTGHSHYNRWQNYMVAGFFILKNDKINTDFPKNISINNCLSLNDRMHLKLMNYGFISQTSGNFISNSYSRGHLIKNIEGFENNHKSN